ncbi:MAG: sulfotransferase [Chitinophagales bacterium]
MAIQVIGTGMGRTGTMSLKNALEILGFNKCHHMIEVMQNKGQVEQWTTLENGGKVDFDALLNGYASIVDFPGSLYYKQLMQKYPDAKFIHTVRNPEDWYKSCRNTIYNLPRGFKRKAMKTIGIFKPDVAHVAKVFDYVDLSIWDGLFKGNFEDKESSIRIFNEWTEEVKRTIPEEKLLIFQAKEGWEPLCNFLDKPIPEVPYPNVNNTAEFLERKKAKFKF